MKSKRSRTGRLFLVLGLVTALLLAGCGQGAGEEGERTPTPAATAEEIQVQDTELVPTPEEPTATPTEPAPTITPTPLPPPTDTPPPPPTDTPPPPPTETPTTAPPTATPEPTAAPLSDAVVVAATLNLRTGPGTGFDSIGSLETGEALVVLGQSDSCTWLKVRSTQGLEGWAAATIGDTVYTSLNLPCDTIPLLVVPTPTLTSPPTPTSPPVAQPTAPPAAANLGCYLIQNQMGVELTFTFTAQDWNWNESFQVPADVEQEYCLSPGHYTYTVDAPPPWSSINGDLQVEAGDRFLWPIRGQR